MYAITNSKKVFDGQRKKIFLELNSFNKFTFCYTKFENGFVTSVVFVVYVRIYSEIIVCPPECKQSYQLQKNATKRVIQYQCILSYRYFTNKIHFLLSIAILQIKCRSADKYIGMYIHSTL